MSSSSNARAHDSAGLATEAANIASQNLDRMSPLEIVTLMNREDAAVIKAVEAELVNIGKAVEIITARLQAGGRLIYTGAGTSGRLGVLDASECPPTFNSPPSQVVGIIAGGDEALQSAVEEAEDNLDQGRRDLENAGLTAMDAVVGISASGRTPYVVGALEYARDQGAATIGLACNKPSTMEKLVDVIIAPVSGPEILAGSTRLKAGTAQKMVLNMLTTATMVQLGKTFGNLMVDVRATNAKLRRRVLQIVMNATGLDEATAEALLVAAGDEPKVAIVMALAGIEADLARRHLETASGRIRAALELAGKKSR